MSTGATTVQPATLTRLGPGRLALGGDLVIDAVAALWDAAAGELAGGETVTLSLDGVRRADSAGVALLVEWLRAARAGGGELRLSGLPAQMRAILAVSDLDTLFPDA